MRAPFGIAVAALVLLASAEMGVPAGAGGAGLHNPSPASDAGGRGSAPSTATSATAAAPPREPSPPEAWLTLGEAWARRGRRPIRASTTSAEDCARAALALARDSQRAHRLLGLVLLEDHRFEEARHLAEALVARAPTTPPPMGSSPTRSSSSGAPRRRRTPRSG